MFDILHQPAHHGWRDPKSWGYGEVDWMAGPPHLVATTSTMWPCADAAIKVAAEDLFGAFILWEDRVLWLKRHGLWIKG